jgi:hypothetical protein
MKITLKYKGKVRTIVNGMEKDEKIYTVLKTKNMFRINPTDSFTLPDSEDIKTAWERYLTEKGYKSYINIIEVEIQ